MADKLSIRRAVQGMLKLQDSGDHATMIGIGPMSPNLLQAAFELARDEDFPLMFIASRNQVDMDELGAGYVNHWNQERFAADIRKVADEVGYEGPYYLCRDHGGPWQRDEERRAHLPEEEAMDIARRSFVADMEAGFDLLMVDPTKDPYQLGKVIPLDVVLRRTVDLISYLEGYRKEHGLGEVAYEVGTEETNGGLTTTDKYEEFISQLAPELERRGCPMPTFIVGQTGTLTRLTEQVGHYSYKNARELADMAKRYGVGLKEHNADYLDDVTLLEHIPAHVTASNVAPQYGTEETRAYLKLCDVERLLVDNGLCDDPSSLRETLLVKAIKTERWRKWMTGEDVNLQVGDILGNEALSLKILDISGHYVFNDPEVKAETEKLYRNLSAQGIDGQRFVVEHIKRPLRQYVMGLNLKGVTTRIERALDE
ncbi:class II D-tagatose-bisphosphate aldolase non-catalytic subunit [Olsenella urininfantis]|uniref:class II D-tagatose-bisphosphate aldolase non-catalytic subunit n=1 Tax=Olsenella urininfantis TaxID=1871033 RepID=UPI000986590A|nr:class II D-tagatose-bisphosphate aldolase, non-catalytic subunit [Olsenella urininfantis]